MLCERLQGKRSPDLCSLFHFTFENSINWQLINNYSPLNPHSQKLVLLILWRISVGATQLRNNTKICCCCRKIISSVLCHNFWNTETLSEWTVGILAVIDQCTTMNRALVMVEVNPAPVTLPFYLWSPAHLGTGPQRPVSLKGLSSVDIFQYGVERAQDAGKWKQQ